MIYFCALYLSLHIGLVTSDAICSCTINDANIYEAPSHSSKVISLLKTGGCLKHDTKQNGINWTKVLIGEVTGYIHKDLAVQTKCNMPASDTEHNQKRADFCMSENCLNCRCHQGAGHRCGECHTCNHHDTVMCNEWINKVDGGWGAWQSWGTCTVTCGGGNQKRTRLCNNPPKQTQFGKDCAGDSEQNQICNTNHCPIDGGWSAWSAYSACSVTCGGGDKVRSRTCKMPAPNYGGAPCHGQPLDVAHCNTQGCPVDGGWSAFSAFSACSVTCGGGTMTRQRTCNNPSPINGGAVCTGSSLDTVTCNDQQCPVDGGWNAWASWIACTNTCGGGIQLRYRLCDNPKPMHNGKECPGDKSENRTCSTNPCPVSVNGGWSTFSAFSACSATCGRGTMVRQRICNNPSPINGGAVCKGDTLDIASCNGQHCPVDGGWSSWTAYLPCSAKCGSNNGFTYRNRYCTSPAPQYNGVECYGDKYQYKPCAADCSSTTSQPLVTTTSVTLTNCYKIQTISALAKHSVQTSSLSGLCPDGTHSKPEAVPIALCGISGSSTWSRGVNVLQHCDSLPTYIPVASFIGGVYPNDGIAGVLIYCNASEITIVTQRCGGNTELLHLRKGSVSRAIEIPDIYYTIISPSLLG